MISNVFAMQQTNIVHKKWRGLAEGYVMVWAPVWHDGQVARLFPGNSLETSQKRAVFATTRPHYALAAGSVKLLQSRESSRESGD